jgi:putative ABC transport system substrate-binding protein
VLRRALFVGNAKVATYDYYRRAIEDDAPALSLEIVGSRMEGISDIEQAVEAFARVPNGGLIVAPDLATAANGDRIVVLAAQHRLPAVYAFSYLVAAAGLASYGTNRVAEMRQAASYIDRILRGASPGELPVQTPTSFETAINLKAANALGLTIPPTLLARADEVIE